MEDARLVKNAAIKASIEATREKRKTQIPVGRRDFKPVERESDWRTNLLAFRHRAVKPEASGSSAQM